MPKDRSKTYSDHQSQAARLKKQQKTKAQPAGVQPDAGKPAVPTSAPSPKPTSNVAKKPF